MPARRSSANRRNIFTCDFGDEIAAELFALMDANNVGKPLRERLVVSDVIRRSIHEAYCRLPAHQQTAINHGVKEEVPDSPGVGSGEPGKPVQAGTFGDGPVGGENPDRGRDGAGPGDARNRSRRRTA